MNKITVIGSGNVGATIAYTFTVAGLCSEIVLIDINKEKALGEALDIRQGTPFCHSCSVYAGDFQDAAGSDIVVLTSGVGRAPGQTRLDLAQTNIEITKSIIPQITRYAPDAIYVIVSNPVDVLTYAFCKESGLPQERVIGSGTILDTSRLRARLSEYYFLNQRNVHAYVLGEHGNSSFVPWSLCNISNVPIEEYRKSVQRKDVVYPELNYDEVEEYIKKSGAEIISRKGATFYAVSVSVAHLCRCILSGVDTTLTVSTMLNGEYGISDVCLSLLNVVGNNGAHSKVLLPLTDEEIVKLRASADTLKEVIKSVNI
ncbi:MAG: L-lactate dehydrogenase [Ruminococcus sp.]|nr:L-lactate dehydrogenase [Oscillospiraceae bacterium]MBR2723939.1 L-lactate dehydrogenase [Ruminococcus sp.]